MLYFHFMKCYSLFLIFLFTICLTHAQVTNTRQGVWSDATAWSSNAVPSTNENAVLNYDIVIDVDAYCRSLNLNGHNATVNSGIQLYVTGSNDNVDTLLSRYVVIDTTVSSVDTFKTIDFYYDDLKRNTSFVSIEYSSNGNPSYRYGGSFFYNGSGRLPYMGSYYSGSSNTQTRFFNYENGRLVYDSSGNTVIHYTYLTDTIIKQTVNYSTSSTVTDTVHVEYDNNGNIVHQIDSTATFSRQNFFYILDNHPNPFNSTQLNCYRVLNSLETFIEESFAKKNMLEVNQYYDVNGHYHSLYGYGYKANGYPKEIWGYDPVNPTAPTAGKALFIYTQ